MNNLVLLELANRWERDGKEPSHRDGRDDAKLDNAMEEGFRAAKRECAEDLRTLLKLLGD